MDKQKHRPASCTARFRKALDGHEEWRGGTPQMAGAIMGQSMGVVGTFVGIALGRGLGRGLGIALGNALGGLLGIELRAVVGSELGEKYHLN